MKKVVPRFYELAPGWNGARVTIKMDGPDPFLTTSKSFEFMEVWHRQKMPDSARLRSKARKKVPDLMYGGHNTPIVAASVKAELETVAAGEAEFRPIALRWADESTVPGDWYLCNILRRIDCFDFDAMTMKRPERPDVEARMSSKRTDPMSEDEYWVREGYWNELMAQMYVDPATIGGAHIWGPRWRPSFIFIADDLLKALRRAGVTGLSIQRLGTRDEPLPKLPNVARQPHVARTT
jgi:hypothetical protein